ncbi:MAG: transporter [Fibrobacteria bacterium]|nr:transporter [Fibrobacteria bacterium]
MSPFSYRNQSEAVAERFRKLKQRPVVLEVKDLTKRFGTESNPVLALDNVSFEVHRREFVCVVGASGCGKSTLVRLLAGLEQPTSGSLLLDGKTVDGPGADRGMVFQGYTLFPWLTVKDNVMFGPRMKGMSRAAAREEADQWLSLVSLDAFADSYPHQLSGGMKQRVAIARALANSPRILLMDEPFGALDAQTRAQMQRHLLHIWKNADVTIVFITHDLDEAIYLADRILVLKPRPGRVAELLEVPVPRPRSTEQFQSPEFLATRRRLEEWIHPGSETGTSHVDELPRLRLTQVGDEVE